MTAHALAARHHDGSLHLFLRVVRAASGIYVVFAAGQRRPGIGRKSYDPHSSWHHDGRVHHKSYDRALMRQRRQSLSGFAGSEPFITTSVDQMVVPQLPECNPGEFTTIMEVRVALLDVTPGRQSICIDLVADESMPPTVGFAERTVERWWLGGDSPSIVVSLYEFPMAALTGSSGANGGSVA